MLLVQASAASDKLHTRRLEAKVGQLKDQADLAARHQTARQQVKLAGRRTGMQWHSAGRSGHGPPAK
jgi:hypothetical protein